MTFGKIARKLGHRPYAVMCKPQKLCALHFGPFVFTYGPETLGSRMTQEFGFKTPAETNEPHAHFYHGHSFTLTAVSILGAVS